jgi:hypothetical protein
MQGGRVRSAARVSCERHWRGVGLRATLVGVACALLVLSPVGEKAASASNPSLSLSGNNVTVNGGVPFAYSVGFTVNGAPESDPITLTDAPSALDPGLTILAVPPQFDWNCSATNITISCVYTPSAPLAPGTFVSLSIEAVAAYSVGGSTNYQAADAAAVSSSDAGSVSADPGTVFNVHSDNVVLKLDLSDSLGAGHSTSAGSGFDYLANLTISDVSGLPYTPQETEPITVTDALPVGSVLTGQPSGTGWDCSASLPTEAVCTYTPPTLGIGGTALPTILERTWIPGRVELN